MISADFFTQIGYQDESRNLIYTAYIPNLGISDAEFTQAYWLGWINYDNLPIQYHLSRYSNEEGVVTYEDYMTQENCPIGYMSTYSSYYSPQYNDAMLLTNNGSTWTYGTNIQMNSSASMYAMLPNKADVNTFSLGQLTLGIVGQLSEGATDDHYEAWVSMNIEDFINDTPFSFTLNGETFTLNPSSFADYEVYTVSSSNSYKITLSSYDIFGNRDNTINGQASNYQYMRPMIQIHNADGKAYIEGITYSPDYEDRRSFDWGSGYGGNGFYISLSDGAPSSPIANIYDGNTDLFGGWIGTFQVSDLPQYPDIHFVYHPDGATFVIRGIGRTDLAICNRIYTYNEIYKTLALCPRIKVLETSSKYENSSDYYYAHVDANTSEFLGEFVRGDNTDDLVEWQLVNHTLDEDEFDADNIPEYTPGGGGDGPSPVDTEGKFSGDPTTGYSTRTLPAGSVNYYALDASNLKTFSERLWEQTKGFYEAVQIAGKQSASIFDYIVCLKYFPLNYDWSSGTISPLNLGTGATFKEADGTTNFQLAEIDGQQHAGIVGSWNLSSSDYHWRKNFLDYSPYLKASIYLPYAGTFELSPEQIASHASIWDSTIYLAVSIDAPTGSITYMVYNQANVMLCQKTVKLAIDLPISGNNQIEQASAILRAQFSTTKTLLGAATSIASGAATGGTAGAGVAAISALPSLGETYLQNSLAEKQVPVEIGSFGGTLSNISFSQFPYITIHRQKVANPDNYGHTTGFLVEGTYKIGTLRGFTKCNNVDVNGITQATEREKAEIKQILEAGFYC